MELNTRVTMAKSPFHISYEDKLLLLGSCFTENIGKKLADCKFRADINPFGILYNPASITSSVTILKDRKKYTHNDLFFSNGLYHSIDHHSRFSGTNAEDCLTEINLQINQSADLLKETSIALITYGSSYVYQQKDSGKIAANCHKLPEKEFNRYPLSVTEIAEKCRFMVTSLKTINPDIKFIFTVSPIRHWKDGAHNNQLSKAALLLAINQIQQEYPMDIAYFPAYEIMLDELRDYRFYADDMIHPSSLAIEYIWQRFTESFITPGSIAVMKEWINISKAINHTPFNTQNKQYKDFIFQTLLKMECIKEKFPYFDIEKEISILKSKLN